MPRQLARHNPDLVLTGGLRYSLLQPHMKTNGNQLRQRQPERLVFSSKPSPIWRGIPIRPTISMNLSGQGNGKAHIGVGLQNLAPPAGFAYSPACHRRSLHSLFGSAGKPRFGVVTGFTLTTSAKVS